MSIRKEPVPVGRAGLGMTAPEPTDPSQWAWDSWQNLDLIQLHARLGAYSTYVRWAKDRITYFETGGTL